MAATLAFELIKQGNKLGRCWLQCLVRWFVLPDREVRVSITLPESRAGRIQPTGKSATSKTEGSRQLPHKCDDPCDFHAC